MLLLMKSWFILVNFSVNNSEISYTSFDILRLVTHAIAVN